MYLNANLVIGLRQGLKMITNKIDEKIKRHAVIPSGPSTGKRYLAIEALPCTEIIEITINKTGQDRLNISNTLFYIMDYSLHSQ